MVSGSVTARTERYQVPRSIATVRSPKADVMNLKDLLRGFVLTIGVLASVVVSVANIGTQVVVSQLFTLLILLTLNFCVFNLLDVKFGNLHNDTGNR